MNVEDDCTFAGYQDAAMRTANSDLIWRERVANFALGLTGEAGEVADEIKKHLYHDKPIDFDSVRDELGDVLWYLTALAAQCGYTLEDVARRNIEKLAARHGGGGFKPHGEQTR